MNEKLLRYNKEALFCVFDFETENLNLYSNKPWQFACIVGNLDGIKEKHNLLINWKDLNVSLGAARITGFQKQKVENEGISPKQALKIITEIFEKCSHFVGHNIIGFDIPIYRSYCRELGREPLDIHSRALDTCSLMKSLPERLDIPPHKDQNMLEYQMKLLNKVVRKRGFASLGGLCSLFNIEYDKSKAHDALYDVEVNYKGFLKLLKRIEI